MFEKALTGSKGYYTWLGFLGIFILTGVGCYLYQFNEGLRITGLSRDVSWGFYIAQFTFLVGVAASAVMLVLPYYLHDVKAFGKITILGEFLAIASVTMCVLFIFVDLGISCADPQRDDLPHAEFHPLLGYDRPERLPVPQHLNRLERPGRRT